MKRSHSRGRSESKGRQVKQTSPTGRRVGRVIQDIPEVSEPEFYRGKNQMVQITKNNDYHVLSENG